MQRELDRIFDRLEDNPFPDGWDKFYFRLDDVDFREGEPGVLTCWVDGVYQVLYYIDETPYYWPEDRPDYDAIDVVSIQHYPQQA